MAAFQKLKEISNEFQRDLRETTSEIFSATPVYSFEDVIAKKNKDLQLLASKLRLLQAKHQSCNPSIVDQTKDELTTMSDYTKTATQKIIEKQVVKSITQNNAVQRLIATADEQLNPELLEKKHKIQEILHKYELEEKKLQYLESILINKKEELLQTRRNWDETLKKCIQSQEVSQQPTEIDGPHYKKLQTLVNKLEVMRWLISKLVTSRTGNYDWTADPHKRLAALALARQHYSIEYFLET